MWCLNCNKELSECVCPDLKERLERHKTTKRDLINRLRLMMVNEAREAAKTISKYLWDQNANLPVHKLCSVDELSNIVQLAISSATAELQKKYEIANQDWAEDHTCLQNLCLKAGIAESKVLGDSYGVPCIQDLAEMLVEKLREENERLKEGKFTPQEFQNLCHNRHFTQLGTTSHEFYEGCHLYQKQLFGESEREQLQAEIQNWQKACECEHGDKVAIFERLVVVQQLLDNEKRLHAELLGCYEGMLEREKELKEELQFKSASSAGAIGHNAELQHQLSQVREELVSEQQMIVHQGKIISDTQIQLSQSNNLVLELREALEAWSTDDFPSVKELLNRTLPISTSYIPREEFEKVVNTLYNMHHSPKCLSLLSEPCCCGKDEALSHAEQFLKQ